MPRTVSLLAGVLAVAAVTYKLRIDVTNNTNNIRMRLDDAKTTLDHVAAGTASKSPSPYQSTRQNLSIIGESKRYLTTRLVPTVKEQWNDQVADVAHRIIHADVSGRAKKMWDENVAPNLK
ncbi:predicted protein [Lichtheimia corymbifera JMRC:FSU:9682]|uniref:MICOS complex subunit MIC12 n=2 Tax=Lichtheimia TaxID=688353 RepID=A0A068RLC6_9FUNG|nr:uncharacterized protein O0I10_005688 [Lichtheimia ornata]KAJ8658648.1 hypothetical protein O0I10_005688 [Lichtheimia ornata]CDH49771.1 predicted protein [Lichtheimia corymbifera JMRC:FSU:9682]